MKCSEVYRILLNDGWYPIYTALFMSAFYLFVWVSFCVKYGRHNNLFPINFVDD